MRQLTLATVGFERSAKTTRRAAFLAEMERVVPWPALWRLIELFYVRRSLYSPTGGEGRLGAVSGSASAGKGGTHT
jgi:hypothetical protein